MARSKRNKTIGCGCDYCASRGIRRDFRQGGVEVDDFSDEPVRFPKKGRGKKFCKRSKEKKPCDFTVIKELREYYSPSRDLWVVDTIKVCERCGKRGWGTYGYIYRKKN